MTAARAPTLLDFDRELVRRQGLIAFARLAWPLVEPGTPFVPNWHLEEIATHLEAVSNGEITKLVINVPPATGKSLFVDVFWPAWDWIAHANRTWINASYDQTLTTRDADRVMAIVRSGWYTQRWGARLPPEPTRLASKMYETLSGGFRFSTSVGGKGLGRHADIQSVNDPTKAKDVMGGGKIVTRALTITSEWWRNTMATRLRNPVTAARVVTMQRLHQSDLAGECIDSGDYVHLCFPMRYDASDPCRTRWGGDRRTVHGELLWPARYPEHVVAKIERDMGTYVTAAQFQQRPANRGGQIFQASQFKHYTDRTPIKYCDEMCLSADLTFKGTDGSDYVAIQCWARKGDNYYLCPGWVNERLSFVDTVKELLRLCAEWPNATNKYIEEKANGSAVESVLAGKVPGLRMINPSGGKESRAHAVQPLFEAGRVWFPAAALEPRIEELTSATRGQLCLFPRASHDDMVDALTQGLAAMWDGGGESYSAAMRELAKNPFLFG